MANIVANAKNKSLKTNACAARSKFSILYYRVQSQGLVSAYLQINGDSRLLIAVGQHNMVF